MVTSTPGDTALSEGLLFCVEMTGCHGDPLNVHPEIQISLIELECGYQLVTGLGVGYTSIVHGDLYHTD